MREQERLIWSRFLARLCYQCTYLTGMCWSATILVQGNVVMTTTGSTSVIKACFLTEAGAQCMDFFEIQSSCVDTFSKENASVLFYHLAAVCIVLSYGVTEVSRAWWRFIIWASVTDSQRYFLQHMHRHQSNTMAHMRQLMSSVNRVPHACVDLASSSLQTWASRQSVFKGEENN